MFRNLRFRGVRFKAPSSQRPARAVFPAAQGTEFGTRPRRTPEAAGSFLRCAFYPRTFKQNQECSMVSKKPDGGPKLEKNRNEESFDLSVFGRLPRIDYQLPQEVVSASLLSQRVSSAGGNTKR